MLEALLSGLRSLRVSLITGGIIVISIYVLLYENVFKNINIRPNILELVQISNIIPIIFLITFSIIIGSLYTTFLEGVVDRIHRKFANTIINHNNNFIKNHIVNALLPYSISAKKRLVQELKRFYNEFAYKDINDVNNDENEELFVQSILVEILWMEGKLAGTLLEIPYDKIKSEGEIRVACGLLIPLAFLSISHIVYASNLQILLSFFFGIITSFAVINYGLYYYKKANSFLGHHIADGKVLSPSMESLKKNNLKNKRIIKSIII